MRPKPRPAPLTGVFVGREPELKLLAEALLPATGSVRPVAVCAIHGMPGVGKSYLVDEFARLHAARFPGGYLRLTLLPEDTRDERALFAELSDRLELRP